MLRRPDEFTPEPTRRYGVKIHPALTGDYLFRVGAAAGIFSLFGFSLGFSGATMVWGWVLVGLLWGVMSLLFAELSSHYPYAGTVYQWSAILGGRKVGRWVGWIYLSASFSP